MRSRFRADSPLIASSKKFITIQFMATAKKTKRKKSTKPPAQTSHFTFDVNQLKKLVPLAKKGDARGILGIKARGELTALLAKNPPKWGRGSYEKILALYLANTFGHDLSGLIYDFAEHTYFRYDDEGYGLAQLNTDLGAIHASDELGLFDESRAVAFFQAALKGPAPESVIEQVKAILLRETRPLPRLTKLAKKVPH